MGVIESLYDGKGSEGQNLLPHLLVLVLCSKIVYSWTV